MRLRLLILKLTATFSLWLCGCNMPIATPQPVAPIAQTTQHTLAITVSGTGQVNVAGGADVNINQTRSSGDSARCDCGCENESCRCSSRSLTRPAADTSTRGGPQIASALKDSKPIVEMLSDFDAGQCGACDLAWSDWKTNGKNWPFTLVKRRGAGGRTSPTFVMPGREPWSPSSYSVGALVERWRAGK